jgi:HAD superfamily hydrolase (TIGR01450 family)
MPPTHNQINYSPSEFLKTSEVFLLDLDGTLYLGDRLIPGASEFVSFLQKSGRRFLILTNNSSKDPAAYQAKLHSLGILVTLDQVFTSGDATIYSLNKKHPGARVFVAGTDHLKELFRRSGYEVVTSDPEVVVLGFDTGITYDTLRLTCDFVRSGMPYFATHPDLNCPVESGFIPDTGAFIAFIAAATGRQPDEICGKPFPAMVAAIKERMNCPEEKMVMVGDRLNTDIALGASGVRTILVLSGETAEEDLRQSEFQPDLTLPSVVELLQILIGLWK